MLADLERSGLTPEDGSFYPIPWPGAFVDAPQPGDPEAIFRYMILYHHRDGRPMIDAQRNPIMYRIRQSNPEQRYTQPTRQRAGDAVDMPYFPPGRDTSSSVRHIAEGEKKAAALVKSGRSAFGIGGMDRWNVPKSRNVLPEILEELKNVQTVVLWPDGDIRKFHVKAAWSKFVHELRVLGKNVVVADMSRAAYEKIDDLLAAGGDPDSVPVLAADDLGISDKDMINWGCITKMQNGKLKVVVCEATLASIVGKSDLFVGSFKWNVRTRMPEYEGTPMDEAALTDFVADMQRATGLPEVKPKMLMSIVMSVCMKNQYDPLKDWLDGLEWDGEERIDQLWDVVGKGSEGNEGAYRRAVARMLLVGSVERVMQPGGKMDAMVVLVGEREGEGKSQFWQRLYGGRNVIEIYGETQDKDVRMLMGKGWLQVMEELDLMSKKNDEYVKALITAQVDTYRPPYGATVVEQPRRCVIVGNTNQTRFLRAEGEHRRFYPIHVTEQIDLDWVEKNREQLWAEAVAVYRRGERWWDANPHQWSTIRSDYRQGVDLEDAVYSILQNWLDQKALMMHGKVPLVKIVEVQKALDSMGIRYVGSTLSSAMRRAGWSPDYQVKGSSVTVPVTAGAGGNASVTAGRGFWTTGNNRCWAKLPK